MLDHQIDLSSRHSIPRRLLQSPHSPIPQRLQPRIPRQNILRRATRKQTQLDQMLQHNIPSLNSRQSLVPRSSQLLKSPSKHPINLRPSRLPHESDLTEYPLDDRRAIGNHARVRQRCAPQDVKRFVGAVGPDAETGDELFAQVVDADSRGAGGGDGRFDAGEVVPDVHGHEDGGAGGAAYEAAGYEGGGVEG
jgi:hypothetical protein